MIRKTIAVIVTGYDWEYETRIIDGIHSVCMENGYNLCCFASLVRKPPINMNRTLDSKIVAGETEIFNLINSELIDGIIILGDNLVREECVFEIAKKAKARGIPVINVNDTLRIIDHNILVDNKDAMEHVVRHLVKDHGLTKINFIGGYPGNIQTEERLAAYKRVLAEFDIPYEESRVGYGEFWVKAREITENFLNSDEIPEAIVCASDTMAFFAIEVINDHGLSVPKDIIVTGFDGIADCESHSPTLTTVRPAYRKLGILSVKSIEKMWDSIGIDQIQYVESELIKHQSCGCEKLTKAENKRFYSEKYDIYNDFKMFNTVLTDMNTQFSKASSSLELYDSVRDGADFFNFKRVFICICDYIENSNSISDTQMNLKRPYGLTEKCVTMFAKNNEVTLGSSFDTKRILPVDFLNEDKPVFMAFSSLYFKDRFLGYIAYEPSATNGNVGVLFHTWVLQIGNQAGSFYMNNELKAAVNQLDDLYARDFLTGLYNRRGMIKNYNIIDSAIFEKAYITVVACDVDRLKVVNDEYGHEGGDNVIKAVATALLISMPEGSICVRTGGDEFLAFFKHKSLVNMEDIVAKINAFLDDYNAKSGLPYKASCSCGYFTQLMDSDANFNDMCKVADEHMYDAKFRKKALR